MESCLISVSIICMHSKPYIREDRVQLSNNILLEYMKLYSCSPYRFKSEECSLGLVHVIFDVNGSSISAYYMLPISVAEGISHFQFFKIEIDLSVIQDFCGSATSSWISFC